MRGPGGRRTFGFIDTVPCYILTNLKNYVWDPDLFNFLIAEYVEGWICFKIEIISSSLIPLQTDQKLEIDAVILFTDVNNSFKHCGYVDTGWNKVLVLILEIRFCKIED